MVGKISGRNIIVVGVVWYANMMILICLVVCSVCVIYEAFIDEIVQLKLNYNYFFG